MSLCPPELLGADHDVAGFDSGRPVLDDWLKRRARRAMEGGSARIYVVCEAQRVVAYYCLSTGGIANGDATGRVRRNMPDPIPVMILGRLAVDRAAQGNGIGRALLRDAALRTVGVADVAGVRALLVHALDETAVAFYLAQGFTVSPADSLMVMATLADLRVALG